MLSLGQSKDNSQYMPHKSESIDDHDSNDDDTSDDNICSPSGYNTSKMEQILDEEPDIDAVLSKHSSNNRNKYNADSDVSITDPCKLSYEDIIDLVQNK